MGLPLLCLIAVSPLLLSHPDLRHHTHPQPLSWPLANPSYLGFRVRAADSQPIGRLPRGVAAAVSSRWDVRDPKTPLMFPRISKEGEAAVCLQHLKFREGKSDAQAYTEYDERAVQCIKKVSCKKILSLCVNQLKWILNDIHHSTFLMHCRDSRLKFGKKKCSHTFIALSSFLS